MVEHLLAKEKVAGSNPVFRSSKTLTLQRFGSDIAFDLFCVWTFGYQMGTWFILDECLMPNVLGLQIWNSLY